MKISSAYLVALLLLALCALSERAEANVAHRRHKHQANDIPGVEAEVEREHKLLIECQNEDYRTYIKCLKREKRQRPDELGNSKHNCLNECFEANCTTSPCIQDCHRRCRTRLIITKTLETSYDCNHESCSPTGGSGSGSSSGSRDGSSVPNITTNIHIQNILPNTTSTIPGIKIPGTGSRAENDTGSDNLPKIEIHNVINNNPGMSSSTQDCPCPSANGCNCNGYNNLWQMLPQITIGFGGGGPIGGGCMFSPWPCLQRYPVQQPSIDCTICYNPMFKIRCDPSCFSPDKNNTQPTSTQRPILPTYSGRAQRNY